MVWPDLVKVTRKGTGRRMQTNRHSQMKEAKSKRDLRDILSQRREVRGQRNSFPINSPQRRGRKPKKIQIFECFFPGCKKKYHPNIIFYRNHLITNHLRDTLEKHILKEQTKYSIEDQRECPFQPCGFYASFK